jgi:hypothetical protein
MQFQQAHLIPCVKRLQAALKVRRQSEIPLPHCGVKNLTLMRRGVTHMATTGSLTTLVMGWKMSLKVQRRYVQVTDS